MGWGVKWFPWQQFSWPDHHIDPFPGGKGASRFAQWPHKLPVLCVHKRVLARGVEGEETLKEGDTTQHGLWTQAIHSNLCWPTPARGLDKTTTNYLCSKSPALWCLQYESGETLTHNLMCVWRNWPMANWKHNALYVVSPTTHSVSVFMTDALC